MKIQLWLSLVLFSTLAGCDGHSRDPDPDVAVYEITLLNATANQPLSPLVAALQAPDYPAWQIGAPASIGLEKLAEGGATMALLQELEADAITATGESSVPPGHSATVSLATEVGKPVSLTMASMLVNTNDAFTGVTDLDLSQLDVGEAYTMRLPVYDAGTELNSESQATIPGPAAAGEGFNNARDDVGFVSMHPGVVSADDGLAGSALDESHRFASASATLKVARVQ